MRRNRRLHGIPPIHIRNDDLYHLVDIKGSNSAAVKSGKVVIGERRMAIAKTVLLIILDIRVGYQAVFSRSTMS